MQQAQGDKVAGRYAVCRQALDQDVEANYHKADNGHHGKHAVVLHRLKAALLEPAGEQEIARYIGQWYANEVDDQVE